MASSEDKVIDLRNAVSSGDKDLVVKLLDQGVDPNQIGNLPSSPLMAACVNRHLDLIRLLISRGAEVDLQSTRYESALSKVIYIETLEQSEKLEVTKILLEHKAKVEQRVLLKAVQNGHTEVVELLITGGDLSLVKLADSLHEVCEVRDYVDPEMVRILLDKDPDIVNSIMKQSLYSYEQGFTPLMKASARGHTEVVKMLLEHGAEIDYQTKIEPHADNIKDREGLSALMVAAMHCKLDTVELLLDKDAAIDLRNKEGKTALMLSASPECMINLRVHNPLAIERAYPALVEVVKLLLDKDAALDYQSHYSKETALIVSCKIGQAEISKLLIEKGANVNHLDRAGGYALLYALKDAVETQRTLSQILNRLKHSQFKDIYNIMYEVIELLLEKGAKAGVVTGDGETAQRVMEIYASDFIKQIELANLKCPRLMEILRPARHTQHEMEAVPLDPKTHSLPNRKRGRSSSTEISEEESLRKTFRDDKGIPGMNSAEVSDYEATFATSEGDYSFSEERSTGTISKDHSSSKESSPETGSDNLTDIKAQVSRLSHQPYSERRFNLVLYGVQESPEGTNLYNRATKDLKDSAIILSKVLPSITDQAIRDCVRIGKYSPTKTRPLLVSFLRALDVRLILQRLSPDVLPSGIAVKPHMSATEKQQSSILLRERWKNMQAGMDKSKIKIRGRKLFIDSRLVGEVVDGEYKPVNT